MDEGAEPAEGRDGRQAPFSTMPEALICSKGCTFEGTLYGTFSCTYTGDPNGYARRRFERTRDRRGIGSYNTTRRSPSAFRICGPIWRRNP